MRKKSHELQWLEMMSQRGGLSEDEIKVYQRLKRGYQGEVNFDNICQLFLEDGVEILDDVTLRYQFDTVQIDKLLMVERTLYLVDVKFYRGAYVFENNEWKVGSTILSNNIYEQLRRAKRVVQNIFREADMKMNVQGVLVFVNPESTIELVDAVQEETLSFEQIPGWLMKLRSKTSVKVPQWKNLLQAFEIESYQTTRACNKERFGVIQKGIRCTQCGGFVVTEDRYKVTCSCGWMEIRETAYVRTICEYGVVMHDRDLDRKELNTFFGKYHNQYLKRVLTKHFALKITSGSSAKYINKGKLFHYWFEDQMDYFDSIEKRKSWGKYIIK